jgi:hypothetical protein
MSSIKLTADSGGGTFELKAPSSGSNARVLTVPDTADGTILTTTNPRAGNILGVSYGFRTGHLQTDSSSFVDTGITANITPSSTSSKILIFINILLGLDHTSTVDVIAQTQMLRDSTAINTAQSADYMRMQAGSTYMIAGQYLTHQDSPSTTNQVTYKLRIKRGSANGRISVWSGSGIILQEVAG